MLFSLVMPTMDRPEEVDRCLASLVIQTYQQFELIVVDQNTSDILKPVLAKYEGKFPIKHIHVGKPIGAVGARNLGAASMTGDVLSFPDDDCWYEPDCLARVADWFTKHPTLDGVTGRVMDQRYYSNKTAPVTKFKSWWQGLEFTLFFRRRIIDRIGLMDPMLGPGMGTPWKAGEGTDYIIRALDAGFDIQFDADLQINHPGAIHDKRDDRAEARCIYKYSIGKGYVLRKHQFPLWYVAYMMARPMVGGTMSLAKCRPSKAWISLMVPLGVVRGYIMSASAFDEADEPAIEVEPSA